MPTQSPPNAPLTPAAQLAIRSLAPGDDSTAFRTLNEEWITRHFTLEAKDRETLGDPEGTILRRGGRVYLAEVAGRRHGVHATDSNIHQHSLQGHADLPPFTMRALRATMR